MQEILSHPCILILTKKIMLNPINTLQMTSRDFIALVDIFFH